MLSAEGDLQFGGRRWRRRRGNDRRQERQNDRQELHDEGNELRPIDLASGILERIGNGRTRTCLEMIGQRRCVCMSHGEKAFNRVSTTAATCGDSSSKNGALAAVAAVINVDAS